MKWIKIGLPLTLIGATFVANAQSPEITICSKEGFERRIEVHYPMQQPLPCEVHYRKGEQVEVLWKAEFSQGYCSDRASDFIDKQRSWGWQCDAAEQLSEEPEESELETEAS